MATVSRSHTRLSSSPELSDPPLSPASPNNAMGKPKEEIVVDPSTIRYDGAGQPLLTKFGHPRRKPGPKPGSRIKRQSTNPEEGNETPKRVRKPKDPNSAPSQRRKKVSTLVGDNDDAASAVTNSPAPVGTPSTISRQPPKISELSTPLSRMDATPTPLREPKRESMPGSMSNILNAEPEPQQSYLHQQQQQQPKSLPQPNVTPRTSGTAYDPIRSSTYDPIRETMLPHSYSNKMESPRGPASKANAIVRASASPSIASLVDPPVQSIISPVPSATSFALNQQSGHSQTQSQAQPSSRPLQDSHSVPASPNPHKRSFAPPPVPKPAITETKKPTAPLSIPAASKIEIRPTSITTIGAAGAKRAASKNYSATSSSPRIHPSKDMAEPLPNRSILDFGRAEPGSELVVPSIVLNIPLNGETNKYVNFMRMAEEQYGWDALHPRQAEQKARKARIAAASAALAQNDSCREGDEMSVDESENEDSNIDMGGTSGPDKANDGKPAKKKRHFKEDEYDRDDDFVDDSELLWEEQAAASRDGFFVYSGPLVREVEKPETGRGEGAPKRGRGSRGGRGGNRGATTGAGRGRGGGAGSRGGATRKPRMTKADKAQMDREKAEREANASLMQTSDVSSYNILQPNSPTFVGLS